MKQKKLIKTERDIVHLRYHERLYSYEIAQKLDLTVHQVKYRLRKSNVKEYIRKKVVPKICKQAIELIDKRLASPIHSYVDKLVADTEAQTYEWIGPGKKMCYSDNMKQMLALFKILRIYGVAGDRKNIERDLRKAVAKHELWLKKMRKKLERTIETGEMRFN
ncbi:MAG: hypothetical protein ACYSU3_07400 [Planctomycetota bacterium]|jgi:DNA-binding CsgD family transcriptional regulator